MTFGIEMRYSIAVDTSLLIAGEKLRMRAAQFISVRLDVTTAYLNMPWYPGALAFAY